MRIDLKELQRLEAEATQGTWSCHGHTWVAAKTDLGPGDPGHGLLNNFDVRDRSDAALIVALRNAAPELLERMAKLEAVASHVAHLQRCLASGDEVGAEDQMNLAFYALDALTTTEPR